MNGPQIFLACYLMCFSRLLVLIAFDRATWVRSLNELAQEIADEEGVNKSDVTAFTAACFVVAIVLMAPAAAFKAPSSWAENLTTAGVWLFGLIAWRVCQ